MTKTSTILAINAGSSSIKLALFTADTLQRLVEITVANIGQPNAAVTFSEPPQAPHVRSIQAANHTEAINAVFDHIETQVLPERLVAIGHRIVHGGQTFDKPTLLAAATIEQLREMTVFDPAHLPIALSIIEALSKRFPGTPQVACFDTSFYRDLPKLARLLPLPRKFEKLGLRRYGFHGLSYESLLHSFQEVAGETAANGRVILAHLGSGASLTAVKHGKPCDTTMSFTPASGVVMSTRAGDIDPGIVAFLHQQTGMTIEAFNHMVHFESGLLGVSGLSADMELLIRKSKDDSQAADAVDLFCYHIQKTIGSFATVLGGLDSLVFAGGIGENAPLIRGKICEGLGYLGVALDDTRNQNHDFLISSDQSSIGVHVIHADEAAVIARQTQETIKKESR